MTLPLLRLPTVLDGTTVAVGAPSRGTKVGAIGTGAIEGGASEGGENGEGPVGGGARCGGSNGPEGSDG